MYDAQLVELTDCSSKTHVRHGQLPVNAYTTKLLSQKNSQLNAMKQKTDVYCGYQLGIVNSVRYRKQLQC